MYQSIVEHQAIDVKEKNQKELIKRRERRDDLPLSKLPQRTRP
jgi:hypothetical protein